MTSLDKLTIHDLKKVGELMSVRMTGEYDLVFIGDSLSELYRMDCRSPLEAKLDDLINTYWSSEGSKAYHAILAAQKINPRTKDIFRSKSTPHTFPWYHRKRKY